MALFLKKTTGYITEIDKLLTEYDRTHPKSEAQLAEIKKYQRVYDLRDNPHKDE